MCLLHCLLKLKFKCHNKIENDFLSFATVFDVYFSVFFFLLHRLPDCLSSFLGALIQMAHNNQLTCSGSAGPN